MGVCIWKCNKDQDNVIKESSIDCYKKTDQSLFANIITSNNIQDDKKIDKAKYKKLFEVKDNTKEISNQLVNNNQKIKYTNSNQNTASNSTEKENYVKSVVKIQNLFRKHTRRKKRNKNDNNKDKEDSILLKLNLDMIETVFSSNSLNNSNISKDNINHNNHNNAYKIIANNESNNSDNEIINHLPFNIKNKLSNMTYKYSGYVKKKRKINSEDSPKIKTDHSNSCEEKEIIDNEEKSGLIKEGFGKFIFKDGTEFCGIFHNNILKNYGRYSNINQKNNNNLIKPGEKEKGKEKEKEIIITDNITYEDYIGLYKNYIPDGFGIYTNLITNLKITGNFGNKGIYGIGIEISEEGGYTYTGEFKNNKKEGLGTIIWKDNCKYQGEFKNNQMHGYGIIEFPGENFYQGEVKNGKMEGFGFFFWNDKRKYFGNYKNDKRNGFGIYMYIINNEEKNNSQSEDDFEENNTSTFIGFWKNGKMDGFGLRVINNDIKYGIWENGYRKKFIESNFALKTYSKWIDNKYIRLFFAPKQTILDFLDDILIINN